MKTGKTLDGSRKTAQGFIFMRKMDAYFFGVIFFYLIAMLKMEQKT